MPPERFQALDKIEAITHVLPLNLYKIAMKAVDAKDVLKSEGARHSWNPIIIMCQNGGIIVRKALVLPY